MENTRNGNGEKKQKLDASASATVSATRANGANEDQNKEGPPQYGSQEYWEERYQKHRQLDKKAGSDEHGAIDSSDNASADALPYHAWYFTFEELAPLILPLILGGRKECTLENADDNDDDTQQDSGQTDTTIESAKPSVPPDQSSKTIAVDKEGSDNDIEEEVDDDGEEEEEMEEREGLAKNGPISIIEIGCGDVPLGQELSAELCRLQDVTGAKADEIVKEIVCCDYSSAVIDLCNENQRRDLGSQSDNTKFIAVDYVTCDARTLPYPNCSFHLIIEKGTLDAMLSDKEAGRSNCTLIMTECARVLKQGGYIVLVSHLNAHTPNGIEWLNTVIVTGLRNGGGKGSKWEIEVHGSDVTETYDEAETESGDDAELENGDTCTSGDMGDGVEGTEPAPKSVGDEEGDAESPSPTEGPGPAVYIIHNVSKTDCTSRKDDKDEVEDDDPPTVPLKFFSY